MKNILIVSHERSGTHYFINSLYYNFQQRINDNKQIDASPNVSRLALKNFFNFHSKKIVFQCFKSHHTYQYLEPFLDEILDNFHVFYIVRDGRDVLTSCWYYFNKAPDAFPHTKSVSELLRIDPSQYLFDSAYSWHNSPTIVDRWVNHVITWIDIEEIHLFRFEDLKRNYEGQIKRIAQILNQDMPQIIKEPTIKDRGVSNRKGIVGDWANHFTVEDRVFFKLKAKNIMKRLGYIL